MPNEQQGKDSYTEMDQAKTWIIKLPVYICFQRLSLKKLFSCSMISASQFNGNCRQQLVQKQIS